MGSFSWLKADNLTNVANIVYGEPFKFLIPKEFGGGFIIDNYRDYGDLGRSSDDENSSYDMFELLAIWNKDHLGINVRWNGKLNYMKEVDEHTEYNRSLGIDYQDTNLKYPLKLVSIEYEGTYEDCKGYSEWDPYQGSRPLYRNEID